jgi:hypothetical protein
VGGRIRFALERFASPRHRSHVAQLFSLGRSRMHIHLPPDFWVFVVIIFSGIFLFVLVSLADAQAAGGWASFAKRYPAHIRPAGNAYSVSSWRYCNLYDNGFFGGLWLRVIFTDSGIYCFKTFHRRFAHPPFLLPWASVKRIEKGNEFVVEVEDAAGVLSLYLPRKVEYDLFRYYKAA